MLDDAVECRDKGPGVWSLRLGASKPKTLNLKLTTLNPKLKIPNTKLKTLNPKLETLTPKALKVLDYEGSDSRTLEKSEDSESLGVLELRVLLHGQVSKLGSLLGSLKGI